jgi:hypothetical protein
VFSIGLFGDFLCVLPVAWVPEYFAGSEENKAKRLALRSWYETTKNAF